LLHARYQNEIGKILRLSYVKRCERNLRIRPGAPRGPLGASCDPLAGIWIRRSISAFIPRQVLRKPSHHRAC
jgi:hypothetical protein